MEAEMDEPDPFEPGTHVFTGTVKIWRSGYGELVTDSGVTVPLLTQGHAPVREGARVTLVTRKLRPRFQIERVVRSE
jgi:hypothetical protein